ncbi:DNA-processing protein DprA [Bacillus sp. FJAT-29790]|uniref:DNA-processing protein DprA n=1 Tax=Bacillus sp. FJAT-29790 TaxID=1895002 RepID=UPI001C2127F6|nr:DNA-processing protein DprA [Bacillus sp. FJAT-29790]MBU8881135.1 DNA-processing protein DprA [Bacillus sp. FJAT-29790]
MDIYWVWLSRIKFVGPVLQKQLLSHFPTPKAVYGAKEDELSEVHGMTKKAIQSIASSRCLKEAESIMKATQKSGVSLFVFDNELYPEFAKGCKESPILLYFRGELKPFQTSVGVVGARRCSSYGRKIAEWIGEELAELNIPVISGFAKGIDSYAQAACVRKGGYTIAFLGCGPDICYPPEQRLLYHKILENGGTFLSKYPPGTPPKPKHFLERNALISAWSTELVIVEAGEQSGALWTANFASQNNKPVYAVPNQIDTPEGAGTNLLLSRGIPPYLGIRSLQTAKNAMKNMPSATPCPDNNILQMLSRAPATILQLANGLNINETVLMDQLLDLELEKKIIIRGNIVYKL